MASKDNKEKQNSWVYFFGSILVFILLKPKFEELYKATLDELFGLFDVPEFTWSLTNYSFWFYGTFVLLNFVDIAFAQKEYVFVRKIYCSFFYFVCNNSVSSIDSILFYPFIYNFFIAFSFATLL